MASSSLNRLGCSFPMCAYVSKKARSYVELGTSGAVVPQLASVRLSEREVSGSIFNDFIVCFDFS